MKPHQRIDDTTEVVRPESSAPDALIRVVIVDDHELVRSGVRSLIGTDPRIAVVGEAEGYDQALARIGALRPDVLLVDLRLGGRSGIELCEAVSERHPSVRTLVLTSFASDGEVVSAIRAGASGFLLKTVDGPFLADAVVRVALGENVIDGAVTRYLMDHIRTPEEPAHPELLKLTDLERAVLVHVAEGLTNREIAPLVDLSPTTVKNHVSSILHKLGLTTRTEVAVFAVRAGVIPITVGHSPAGPSARMFPTSGR